MPCMTMHGESAINKQSTHYNENSHHDDKNMRDTVNNCMSTARDNKGRTISKIERSGELLTDNELSEVMKEANAYLDRLEDVSRMNYQMLRRQFVFSKIKKNILSSGHITIKSGRFSYQELKIVKSKVRECLGRKGLSVEHMQDEIVRSVDSDLIKTVARYVCSFLPYRTFESVHVCISYYYHPYYSRVLTGEDDVRMVYLRKVMGSRWRFISEEMRASCFKLRSRYCMLQERQKERMCKADIFDEFVSTRSIAGVARKFNVRTAFVIKSVNERVASADVNKWPVFYDFVLAVLVLKNNYWCSVNGAEDVFAVLDSGTSNYDTDKLKNEVDRMVRAKNADENGLSNKERTDVLNAIITQNNEATQCALEKVFDGPLNYSVQIREEDIFWLTVKRMFCEKYVKEFVTANTTIFRSKFSILCKKHGMTCYEDVVKYVKEKTAYFIFEKLKGNHVLS